MPLWHNMPDRQPYTGQDKHHWLDVVKYNSFLASKGKWYLERKPSALYYQYGQGRAYSPPSFYNENLKKVTEKQLSLMADHGIDFVIYNSYWERWANTTNFGAVWHGVIDNWLPDNGPNSNTNWDPSPDPLNTHGIKMAIKWTTHYTKKYITENPGPADCRLLFQDNDDGGLNKMIDYWAQYMKLDDYKTTPDGRPMFYVSGVQTIANIVSECRNDQFFDSALEDPNPTTWIPFNEMKVLLKHMNNRFKQKAELSKDVYFVAAISGEGEWYDKWDWMLRFPDEGGFDASTTLRYDAWTTGDEAHLKWPVQDNRNLPISERYSHDKMTRIYDSYNNYVLNNSYSTYPNTRVDYQVPVSAGWNEAPKKYKNECWDKPGANLATCGNPEWDYMGSTFDDREGTPTSFESALWKARSYANRYPSRTDKTIVIYAWNEHNEGTVIEPTMRWGYQFLDKIIDVFGGSTSTYTGGGTKGGSNWREASEEINSPEVQLESLDHSIQIVQSNHNPAKIELRMTLTEESDLQVQVVDLNGKVLRTEKINGVGQGKSSESIDLTGVASGVYIVRATAQNMLETRKIVID